MNNDRPKHMHEKCVCNYQGKVRKTIVQEKKRRITFIAMAQR